MKHLLIPMLFLTACSTGKFHVGPAQHYQNIPQVATIGKPEKRQEVYDFLKNKTEYDAFVAIRNDSVLASWGDTDLPIMTHSARKSIMSVLYGMAVEKGYLRLNQTLSELGIDDTKAPLTPIEKTCTIRDLLMSRSGIYIEASGETQNMKDSRPKRGAHRPGEFYYYNNWGFNVLGTILEKQTKMSIGQVMDEWLAKPLGMKTFRANHVTYKTQNYTEHRQYIIYLSAEDLARIGMLMANGGIWRGQRLLSGAWVDESTLPYSAVGRGNKPLDSFAYLWWNDTKQNTFWADGWGGQFMLVDRKNKLVVVSRNDTGRSLLGQGLFMWLGKQGYRDHHQHLYGLMKQASGVAP